MTAVSQLAGRLDELTISSTLLAQNPLGDPSERPLWIYVPPRYDLSSQQLPVVYWLSDWGAEVPSWANRNGNQPTVIELIDAAFASGESPPCLVAFVDGWTRLGGSQYVDSPGTGLYHSYFCEEVVPYVDSRYRTLTASAHRGVGGHSTGGFAAGVSAMLRPDLFGGFANHAGDGLYEYLYLPVFAKVAKLLRDQSSPDDGDLSMVRGVAACFSTDDDGTVRLPFDDTTGLIDDDVWARWQVWDPVRMVSRHADAMRSMRAIWIDAGRDDEYNLDLASMALAAELRRIGVRELHFELHDGGHENNEWRYPLSIAYLARYLS